MDLEELIDNYNTLCKKHKAKKSSLSELTDQELFIFIAGETLKFGRPLEKSLENATNHMLDRKKAEKLFSERDKAYPYIRSSFNKLRIKILEV